MSLTLDEYYMKFLEGISNNSQIETLTEYQQKTELNDPVMLSSVFKPMIEAHLEIKIDHKEILNHFKYASLSIAWRTEFVDLDWNITGGFLTNGIVDALNYKSTFWKGAFSLAPDVETPHELKHFEKLGWFEV